MCHRKIDPLGFALESFGPIGQWRTKYPKANKKANAPKVDPSGKLPSGETYADFSEFRTLLVTTRRDLFVRGLVNKLLTYSTGRPMQRADRYEIDDICRHVEADGFGLRTLVTEALTSDIFRSR